MLLRYATVLFDLDDTLIDRNRAFRRATRRIYEMFPAMQAGRTATGVENILVGWERVVGPHEMAAAMLQEWPSIGLEPAELWRLFRATLFEQIHPDAAVIDLVSEIRGAGAKTGIITNGDARQTEKVRLAGLMDLFDVVLVSETVGIRKPAPEIFHMALAQVGSLPASALFVGDNPPIDIEGARSAGLSTAWVRAGRDWPESVRRADYEADTLLGLSDAFFRPNQSR